MGMHHVAFNADVYAPRHAPNFGQRLWVDMTYNRAEEIAKKRIEALRAQGWSQHVNVADLATSLFHEGMAPDMRIEGFDYEHGRV